jgi:hypothetical protein
VEGWQVAGGRWKGGRFLDGSGNAKKIVVLGMRAELATAV